MSNIINITCHADDTTYVFEKMRDERFPKWGKHTIEMTLRNTVWVYAHLVEDNPYRARIVPPSVLKEWDIQFSKKHQEAYDADLNRLFTDYREAQNNMTPEQEAEHMYELRAAFGPGERIIDVISGKEYHT